MWGKTRLGGTVIRLENGRHQLLRVCPATSVAPCLDLASELLRIAAYVLDQTIECLRARYTLEGRNNGSRIVRETVDRDLVGVGREVDQDAHPASVALCGLCKAPAGPESAVSS